MNKHNRHSQGFTIIELITVIVVIIVLATITIFAIGPWRTRTAETEVKNALTSAASTLNNYKVFNGGYPTGSPPTMPASYETTPGVTMTYISGTSTSYCLRATSTAVTTVVRYMTQANASPQAAACT